ncbi:MAG TPA: hypothetical protein VNG29_04580, partial [Candidatus Paceibacterota bacterium]|nr:hypothetical protein [Candidatus Paceibacterota bacterium]
MSARKKYLLLACILIIATFLRLYHFTWTPPGLYPDEAMDGNNALEAYHAPNFWSALKVYYPEDNGREGLYVNTIALLMKATGGIHEPWIVRLPAAISGILTVLGMFYLVSELFREHDDKGSTDPGLRREDKGAFENWKLKIENSEVALLAAFLLATSFWHINFSRIGFRAIMAPLFLTWALYFLLKAIRAGNFQSSIFPPKADPPLADNFQKRWVFAVLGGISFGLGFYTYIAYRVSPLLLLLFVPFFRREKYFWKATLVFLAVAFVVALPIGLYYLHHPGDFFGRTSQISVSNSASPVKDLAVNIAKTLGMFNIHGDNNWRQNISGAPELYWPVGLLFLLGIVLGLRSFFKKEPPDSALSVKFSIFNFSAKGGSASGGQFSNSLLFLWFILAMLPVVLSDEGIPHALRSILMIPPVIIFAAIGGVALYRWLAVRMRA